MNLKDEALKMAIEELHNALKLLKRFTPQSTGDGSWTAWTVGLKDQLSDLQHTLYNNGFVEGINACKKALEQPAQEPVAWIKNWADGSKELVPDNYEGSYPVYPHPAQPLSDDEIDKLLSKFVECLGTSHGIQENGIPEDSAVKFIRAIEQAHGIGVNK